MATKPIVNTDGISQAAKTYDPLLRVLPYVKLNEVAGILRLNIQEVENEDVVTTLNRKAGATGPYKPGMDIDYQEEMMKFFEATLKPVLTVAKSKDNITLYTDKKILTLAGKAVDNKAKNHPLEMLIVNNAIISHAEDVTYSLFFAERDESVFSPMTAFDGYFTKLDVFTTAGLIAVANKNLKNTGAFAAPASETDYTSYDKLVDWLADAHPSLRSSQGGAPLLTCAQTIIKSARSALRMKLKLQEYPSTARLLECLREDAFIPGLEFNTHEAVGTGSKLMLHKPGLFDIGFNTQAAAQFCQVRAIFPDPNDIQFWIQAAYDTRIQNIHPKVFYTNEQSNAPMNLAGDY
jgi:hypothetical protein